MTTLWQITTIAPNGHPVITHGHTTTQAVREMLRRRKRGHKLAAPCATPEPEPGTQCQSTNHSPGDCYGDLWQCERCGKTVCYAEGTDDHPELCDDCWTAEFVPCAQQGMQPVTAEGRA